VRAADASETPPVTEKTALADIDRDASPCRAQRRNPVVRSKIAAVGASREDGGATRGSVAPVVEKGPLQTGPKPSPPTRFGRVAAPDPLGAEASLVDRAHSLTAALVQYLWVRVTSHPLR